MSVSAHNGGYQEARAGYRHDGLKLFNLADRTRNGREMQGN